MALPTCSDAARTRTVEVYIELEATAGTAETLVSDDYVEITNNPTLPTPYGRADLENLTRTSGLGKLPSQLGQITGQELVLTTYAYHSASAGAVPHLADLWYGLTGTSTTDTGVSVTYSASAASSNLPSLTVLVKTDNQSMSFAARVNSATLNITPTDDSSALITITWNLQIWKWYFYCSGSASGTSASKVVSFTDKGDSARFSEGAIVNVTGYGAFTVDSVNRTAGTITLVADPGDGAVTLSPWSPGVPASPTWNEYQFLAHEVNFTMSTLSEASESSYELPFRDITVTWNNNLLFRNNETGRGIGNACVNRVANRDVMIAANIIQYSEVAEWATAAAENRDVDYEITMTAADGSTRTLVIEPGTDGVSKIRIPGSPSDENGLIVQSAEITCFDSAGGDDEMTLKFA